MYIFAYKCQNMSVHLQWFWGSLQMEACSDERFYEYQKVKKVRFLNVLHRIYLRKLNIRNAG